MVRIGDKIIWFGQDLEIDSFSGRCRYRWRPDSRFLSNTTTTGADFTTCWPHTFLAFPYYQLHLILLRMGTKHEKEDGLVHGKIDGSCHSPAGVGCWQIFLREDQRVLVSFLQGPTDVSTGPWQIHWVRVHYVWIAQRSSHYTDYPY